VTREDGHVREVRVNAGIGYRRAHRDALLAHEPITLEVMPDHFFADPPAIDALAARHPIVLHDVGLSIATAGDTSHARDRLRRIRDIADRAKPILFSDHLAITRSPDGTDLGHLAPIWLVPEVLDLVCDRVSALQDTLGVPVALENISTPFTIPGGSLTEPEFFTRLVERTGCGMLLDVTNVLLDARNGGFDPRARLREYPLEAVRQIHLAGGVRDHHGWVDSHSEPVEDASFELLAELRRAKDSLVAIIIERDSKLGSLDALVAEAEHARHTWENACR